MRPSLAIACICAVLSGAQARAEAPAAAKRQVGAKRDLAARRVSIRPRALGATRVKPANPKSPRDEMHALIRAAHAGQTRNAGRVDYWVHTQSVAEIVEDALHASGELAHDSALKEDLFLAAQGHDLFEDTKVDATHIRASFGPRVAGFISGMTNKKGDKNRAAYVEQMVHAPEEVRLIKYADLIDNATSAAYGLHDLGKSWGEAFLLPIVNEMSAALAPTTFVKYPKAAMALREQLRFAMRRFEQNLGKFEIKTVED